MVCCRVVICRQPPDGSVLVTHGGVEIGQGLHTKVCQIAAQVLGIPVDRVHIEETATDRVPNSSPTAASASTDLYGGAVKLACDELAARLKPYWDVEPKPKWEVRAAQAAAGLFIHVIAFCVLRLKECAVRVCFVGG